jgi:hypothetical protein
MVGFLNPLGSGKFVGDAVRCGVCPSAGGLEVSGFVGMGSERETEKSCFARILAFGNDGMRSIIVPSAA